MVGIYLLKNKNEVVYVGQSVNIHRRVEQHKDKDFDNYDFIECEKALLNCTEEFYILKHNPKYNKKRFEITVRCSSDKEARTIKKIAKEVSKNWKHLRVEESTHKRVKALGVFKSMSIDEVINYLVDKESNKSIDRVSDYRKRG